eukprot:5879698-Prymnesium_polylepis.2
MCIRDRRGADPIVVMLVDGADEPLRGAPSHNRLDAGEERLVDLVGRASARVFVPADANSDRGKAAVREVLEVEFLHRRGPVTLMRGLQDVAEVDAARADSVHQRKGFRTRRRRRHGRRRRAVIVRIVRAGLVALRQGDRRSQPAVASGSVGVHGEGLARRIARARVAALWDRLGG